MAAALACVGAKRLIFILVTHTNRTAERQCSRRDWQLFQNVLSVHLRWLGLGERDKRASSKAFQPPATEAVITAVTTQKSSSFLGKARKTILPRARHMFSC